AAGVTKAWTRALELTHRLTADAGRPLAAVLDDLAGRHGDAPALLSADCAYSFADLAARTRRYTRWARVQGYGAGDVVALLAPNHPDYFAAWVGISRTGATVALLNTNLEDRALAHCLHVADARALLVAPSLQDAYASAAAHLERAPGLWPLHAGGLDLTAYADGPLSPEEATGAALADRALLIFTSGTTGLPKAANVSHARVLTWCGWFAGMMDAAPDDRLYNCLPMYHSVGGVVAVGGVLLQGGSVFVRERFSARAFWDEVVAYDCTLFQYIGELCRFLLNSAPHPLERAHALRLACGNGLREEVWTAFQARFSVPRVLEFYAATEGSFSLYNVEGRPGAIGRVPPFLAHRFPAAIVRYDPETGAPVRDEDGHCVRCAPNEPGEAIGRIATAEQGGANRFEGYTSGAESDRKVLRDVFAPGDAWFRTGDLMRRDAAGFFYFVDRVGDTFRWKGENVSTAEVADVLAACPGVTAAAVYGVELPGCDGRAGMAALTTGGGVDLAELARRIAAGLPSYARPVLLRLCDDLAATETFKLKKAAMAEEGFDPGRVGDPLFRLEDGVYVPLDLAAHAGLVNGTLRV
uniref:long-chain-acyl-CoA synthetase n=1 Tax=Caulobacter sp. S45 TaxID=1641861 RepID=UPI001C2D52B7